MITSLHNARVAEALKLRKRALRERRRMFLVEGAQAVEEAVRAGVLVRLFHGPGEGLHPTVVLAEQSEVQTVEVSDEIVRALTSTVTPQGLVGVAPFIDAPLEDLPNPSTLAAVLCAVRDPGNAGTVLRSADAAGGDAVVFSEASVDVYNAKVVRSSAGSLFHLPVVRDAPAARAVAALRERGVRILAASGRGRRSLYDVDLTGPIGFLFGNEAWGMAPEVEALADESVRIPIPGRAESLNLATAAGICLFEAIRQRQAGPAGGRGSGLDALIAGAAHDVRSPLTALRGMASTMAARWDRLTDDQRAELLRGILHDADRTNAVLRELVDAARVTAGRLQVAPEPVDLEEAATWVSRWMAANPNHPPVAWEGASATVMADPERLQGALVAMAEAAAWHGQEGEVRIDARRRGDLIDIGVARAGTDLTPGEAETLLESRGAGAGGGSKLGLFVARAVAQAHGGSLDVEVAGGIRFVLRLPAR